MRSTARGRHARQQRLRREAVAGALVVGRDAPLVAEVERDLRPVEAVAPGLGREQAVGGAGRRAARQHEAARRRADDQLAEPLDRRVARRGRRRGSCRELRDGGLEALVALVDARAPRPPAPAGAAPTAAPAADRGRACAARPRPRRGARPRSAPCRRSGRRRSSEPERMSRRASLVSSTLGWRSVRLRIQAASSRACACERPACVTSMRSRRVERARRAAAGRRGGPRARASP